MSYIHKLDITSKYEVWGSGYYDSGNTYTFECVCGWKESGRFLENLEKLAKKHRKDVIESLIGVRFEGYPE